MLGCSLTNSFQKIFLLKLFALLVLFLSLLSGCDEDNPVLPGMVFNLTIDSPQDSSSIYYSLQINISTNSNSPLKQVMFYIDDYQVVSDSLGNNLYIVDVSNFADDNFHKIKAVATSFSGATGYSNNITLRIIKSAKYRIHPISPEFGYIERINGAVELRWLDSRSLSNTTVEISKNYSFANLLYSSNASRGKHLSPSLEAGMYYWRLKAEFRDTSLTIYSEVRNFEIAGPNPPTLISPANNQITSGSEEITFAWSKSVGATQYELLVLDDESKDTIVHTNINSDSTFTTILPINAYNWKMRARNFGGVSGDWSNQLRFGHGVFYKIVDAGAMLMPIEIKKTVDGNFLILGNAMPFEPYSCLTKISPEGSTIWSKRFDGTVLKSFDVLSDGSLIVVGEETKIMPVYTHYSKILKLDMLGNIIWENLLSNISEIVTDIAVISDGYIISGSSIDTLSNSQLPMLLKISLAGDLVYRKLFEQNQQSIAKIFNANNSIVAFGYSSDQNNLLSFEKFDLLGNELYKKSFTGKLVLRGAKKLSDESFLVGGFIKTTEGMFIKKINSSGDALVESEFNLSVPCGVMDVSESLSDNYFVTGYLNNGSQENRIYFGKLDASGVVLNQNQYPGESGYSLVATDDGGYIILGYITNGVMCVIKTNSSGTSFIPE